MIVSQIQVGSYFFNPHAIPVMLAGMLVFFIGIFIFTQTHKNYKNIAFVFFCMSLSLWLFPMGFVYMAPDSQIAFNWYRHVVFLGVVNIMPSFFWFSAAMVGSLRRQFYAVIVGFIICNVFYILANTTNFIIRTPRLFYWGFYPQYEPTVWLFFVVYAVLFLASEKNLWVAYRSETIPVKKTHNLTIFIGLLIGFLASFDFVAKVSSVPLYPFGFVPSIILSAMVAFSVIRHRAFDIETVIHKTILWVLSFTIIMLPILVVYYFLFPYISSSFVYQLIFSLLSMLIYTVYLRSIQPNFDRWFHRSLSNLDQISKQFTADLVHLKDFDSLIIRIQDAIGSALYPQWEDIFIIAPQREYVLVNRQKVPGRGECISGDDIFVQWMAQHDGIVCQEFIDIDPLYESIRSSTRKYFEITEAWVVIPLVLNERLLGIINLGKKSNLKKYKAIDFNFLTNLKNQSAIAISNSLMYQSIEEQVKERTRELVDVQKQLIQAEKLATVGTLSGGVAHEINNPLTAILTNVQMLLAFNSGLNQKEDRESLEMIEEATQRCRSIVQKLMVYARKPLAPETDNESVVDLRDVLHKSVELVKFQLEQDNVDLRLDVGTGVYRVRANQNELEQVVMNLILNARDAILVKGKTGTVNIKLFQRSGRVLLRIKDNGGGISPEILQKIFDPFFTTKDVGKGLGLGLSICQSIVEKYQGGIRAESDPGDGAVFTVDFPAAVIENDADVFNSNVLR